MRIGILALQGAFAAQERRLQALGAESALVRNPETLAHCDGLILPGGESSTMILLMRAYGLWEAVPRFAHTHPVWGICAGAILIAAKVLHPKQPCLGLLPLTVQRNAYGRQNESSIATIQLQLPGCTESTQEAVFIRAPRILTQEAPTQVLARFQGDVVAAGCASHLVTTFHPELSPPTHLHRYFLAHCAESAQRRSSS